MRMLESPHKLTASQLPSSWRHKTTFLLGERTPQLTSMLPLCTTGSREPHPDLARRSLSLQALPLFSSEMLPHLEGSAGFGATVPAMDYEAQPVPREVGRVRVTSQPTTTPCPPATAPHCLPLRAIYYQEGLVVPVRGAARPR